MAIQNDSIKIGEYIFCGTRGWTVPEENKEFSPEDEKLYKREIERLKYMLNQSDMKVEFNSCKFEIGDEVEIARGPLKGLSGRLCYVDNGKPLIGIYLDMLGYACVTIDKNDVEIKNKAI